jgi:hypothetical protein
MLMLPASPEVVAAFIAQAQAAPEELSTIANIMPAPPRPFVPPAQHGRLVVMALMAYAGKAEAGERDRAVPGDRQPDRRPAPADAVPAAVSAGGRLFPPHDGRHHDVH